MKKKSIFLIRDPKNLYGHILDAESAKIAKSPLLGVVLEILRVKYLFFIKNSAKFVTCDPKNPMDLIWTQKAQK